MSINNITIEKICDEAHEILLVATSNFSVPSEKQARDVRKKISVFTYGVIDGLASNSEFHKDEIYEKYLIRGGLSIEQAKIIVNSTRDEFSVRDYGNKLLQLGRDSANQWSSGNKNIKLSSEVLL